MSDKYDSAQDTEDHKKAVKHFMGVVIIKLSKRGLDHDNSKLEPPEKETFDEFTPLLKTLEYGSQEYKDALKNMGVALNHHYENNSHHPEHFENGINGMSLIDLLEMFCDWQAAFLRMGNGSFEESLEINRTRFEMSDQLYQIFLNTLNELW